MAKKNTQKNDSAKTERKTQLKEHKQSKANGKNQKGTGPRTKK